MHELYNYIDIEVKEKKNISPSPFHTLSYIFFDNIFYK